MAKKKGKPRVTKTTEAPPPARVRHGVNVNVWIADDLGAAFERAVETVRPRASKTAHLEEALRHYLRKLGLIEDDEA